MSANNIKNGTPVGPVGANKTTAKTVAEGVEAMSIDSTKKPEAEAPKDAKSIEAEKKKQEKLERRRIAEERKESAIKAEAEEKEKKLEMFDSTKLQTQETRGTRSITSFVASKDQVLISGRNVGAEENEPDWDEEQLKYINYMSELLVPIVAVKDTRRNQMDPEMKYITKDVNGTMIPLEAAYLNIINPEVYSIGVGRPRYDTIGGPKYYIDVVMSERHDRFLLTQWISEMTILEGVSNEVMQKQGRASSQGQANIRRIGHHFARIGLPKSSYGPVFATLKSKFPGVMSQVIETKGFYWMNASWGVSSFQASFSYTGDDNKVKTTGLLKDVMAMLDGSSCNSVMTIAISVTCGAKTVGVKTEIDPTNFSLSVKIHNVWAQDTVDFHGPPQQGSTGMMVPERLFKTASKFGRGPALAQTTAQLTNTTGFGDSFLDALVPSISQKSFM